MNVIYTTVTCPWCQRAKLLMDKHGIAFEEIDVSTDQQLQQEMMDRSKRMTVPQIFFGDDHVGGYEDLVKRLETPAAA